LTNLVKYFVRPRRFDLDYERRPEESRGVFFYLSLRSGQTLSEMKGLFFDKLSYKR
jgi:hypothetical protein